MKTVSSLAQATQLAARSGASLEVNGRRINSAGTKLSVVAPKPAPAAEPAPAAPAQGDPLDRIALLIARQGEAMRSAVEALARHQQPAPSAPAVTRTVRARPSAFEVERNEEGVPVRLIPIYDQAPLK